jgi:hypothetical protein
MFRPLMQPSSGLLKSRTSTLMLRTIVRTSRPIKNSYLLLKTLLCLGVNIYMYFYNATCAWGLECSIGVSLIYKPRQHATWVSTLFWQNTTVTLILGLALKCLSYRLFTVKWKLFWTCYMCTCALSKCYLKWGFILNEVLPEVRCHFKWSITLSEVLFKWCSTLCEVLL